MLYNKLYNLFMWWIKALDKQNRCKADVEAYMQKSNCNCNKVIKMQTFGNIVNNS